MPQAFLSGKTSVLGNKKGGRLAAFELSISEFLLEPFR